MVRFVIDWTHGHTQARPISLDFKDGNLQDIFRLFADISGLNVVVNPGVQGIRHLQADETLPGTTSSTVC